MHINPARRIWNNKVGLDAYTTTELQRELDNRRTKEQKEASETSLPDTTTTPADLQTAIKTQLPKSPTDSTASIDTHNWRWDYLIPNPTIPQPPLSQLKKPNPPFTSLKPTSPTSKKAFFPLHHPINSRPQKKHPPKNPPSSRSKFKTRYAVISSLYNLIDELKDVLKMFDSITLEEGDDGVLLLNGIGEVGGSVAYILGLAESVVACVEKSGNVP